MTQNTVNENIISKEKLLGAIYSFDPYKYAVVDGIGHVQKIWRQVKWFFIPKSRKIGHSIDFIYMLEYVNIVFSSILSYVYIMSYIMLY